MLRPLRPLTTASNRSSGDAACAKVVLIILRLKREIIYTFIMGSQFQLVCTCHLRRIDALRIRQSNWLNNFLTVHLTYNMNRRRKHKQLGNLYVYVPASILPTEPLYLLVTNTCSSKKKNIAPYFVFSLPFFIPAVVRCKSGLQKLLPTIPRSLSLHS